MNRPTTVIVFFIILSLLTGSLFCPIHADTEINVRFTDVSEGDWFCESVSRICGMGLMIGTDTDTFSPAKQITGAEAVTLLARVHAYLTGEEKPLSETASAASPWYQGYVDYCLSKRLLNDDLTALLDTYMHLPLTRTHLTALLSGLPDSIFTEINTVADNAIPDVPADAPYAAAIYRAYRCGITVGVDEKGCFCPDLSVSRAETAAMLIRIVDPKARLTVTLTETETRLYAADGTVITVPNTEKAVYLASGWKETPYTSGFSAELLLNAAVLTPASTGYQPLDAMVDRIFDAIITDSMTTYEKVKACYDYLVRSCTYGTSPVSGKYRTIYQNNPYISPSPAQICSGTAALSGDRGYVYFYKALQNHALEAYTVMYASEMLDGLVGWCDHYSAAFAVMMRRIGLPCFPVYVNSKLGDGYKPHMTTVMTVGGVDCIFDPQIEAVLVGNTGRNDHKRFCRPISEMTAEYRDFGDLEDCRSLFGPFVYDNEKMTAIRMQVSA